MPERRLFPEFRDEYEPTRYPFADNSTLTPTAAGMQPIDQDLFLDASLYPIGATGSLYLSRVSVTPRAVTLFVSDSLQVLAFVTFDPLFAPEILRLGDAWGRPAGVIVSDASRLARFGTWSTGEHTYRAAASTFAVSCVIPVPETGVRGIITEDGDLFTKDALIVGDNGVVVRQEPGDPSTIRVDIVGDPLSLRTLCSPIEVFNTPRFIQTINGCPPDSQGNFNITVGDHYNEQTVLRVYPTADGLVIEAVGETIQQHG